MNVQLAHFMQFVCKLVKDCLHSDGIRDYQFKATTDEALLAIFDADDNFKIEKRTIRDRIYLRLLHDHYKVYGFLHDHRLRVEFQDFHPPDARDVLEKKFEEWD